MNLTSILHMAVTSEGIQNSAHSLVSIADAGRKDPDFRSRVDKDPDAALAENGVEATSDMGVRI